MDKYNDYNKTAPVYQLANSSDETIKKNFIVRKIEFQTIINSLKDKSDKDSLQHELILGRRGSGKSTLLKRIEVEVKENPKLKKKYIPVNLAEEQAGIYRLFDLWEQVIDELSSRLEQEIKIKDYFEFPDEQEYTRYLYDIIHETTTKNKKKIVLLLDNFDRIVENFTDDGHLLRELLINYNDMVFITASTRMDEHFWSYDKPFYEFFRKHRLEALSRKETFELLEFWSRSLEVPQVKDFIEKYPGKVENIRLLTDGLPRTMRFFLEIILHNEKPVDVDFLKKIMDDATPQYQERLNYLTPQMRKMVLEMAFIWEACTTKQLVEKCKMESKLISANLKTLTDRGVVETIPTEKRNNLYRVSERFFNMWLIVTQGNPEQKRKVRWLSIFLENWYDATELQELAQKHIDNLKNKKLESQEALLLTKGFAQSHAISTLMRDEIIELTEQQIGSTDKMRFVELPKKVKQINKEIEEFIDVKNFKKAQELINSIENEADGFKERKQGNIYKNQGKQDKAKKQYLLAIEKGDNDAIFNLALLYDNQGKQKEAEKYYLLAIEKGDNDAIFNLALLYTNQGKQKEAEKYYLLAIEKGDNNALNNLANLYTNQGKQKEAEKYYLLAIEKGNNNALFNLALLYDNQGKQEEAEQYYLLAIEKGNNNALFNLALLYDNQGKQEEAEQYYLLAIEKGNNNAIFYLALLYNNQGKQEKAEKYYLLAIEKGVSEALNNLANLYTNQGKQEEAEKYYLLAIEKGDNSALNNLATLYFSQEKLKEAEKYYLLAIEKGDNSAIFNLANLYVNQGKQEEAEKYYLLAIEKGDNSALNNLATLYFSQEKLKEAEKYYLLAIETGNNSAIFNLANLYVNQGKQEEAEKYYLLAIEKGDNSALNNLATLYFSQEKLKEAEKYYLLAIKKGYNKALWNLISMYYLNNQDKEKARKYIKKYKEENILLITIEIWSGIFNNVENRVYKALSEERNDRQQSILIERLLVHNQNSLVYKAFTHPEFGKKLQDKFQVLYYACLILNNETGDNLLLKIPPELETPVKDVLEEIKSLKEFYSK